MGQFGIGQAVQREEDPRLLRGVGEFVERREPAAHGLWLRPALAACACADPKHRYARGAADAGRARGADRRRSGRRTASARCRCDAAQTPRRLADVSAPHPGLARERPGILVGDPVAFVVAENVDRRQGRGRAHRGRLRAAAVGRRSPATRPARRARGLGRLPRQNASYLRDRRQSGGRCRFRQGASCDAPAFRHQPHHREHDGAARLHRRLRRSGSGAPRSMAARSGPPGARRASPRVFKMPENRFRVVARRYRRRLRHRKAATSPKISWRSGPRARSAGRSNGSPSAARASSRDDHGRDNVTEAELALDKDGKFLALRVKHARQYRRLSRRGRRDLLPTSPISARSPASNARRRSMSSVSASSPTRRAIAPLSRRRPARGVAMYRGHHRPRGARDGHRPRRAAPPQHRSRRARCRSRPGSSSPTIAASSRRTWTRRCTRADYARLRGAPRRGEEARQAARHRHRQRDRARRGPPGGETAEIRFDADRHGDVRRRHDLAGPEPRDDVQDHPVGQARHRYERRSRSSRATPTRSFGAAALSARARRCSAARPRCVASEKIIAKGKKIAAHIFEAAEADIEFANGTFAVAGTDKRMPIKEVARAAFHARAACRTAWSPASSRSACSIRRRRPSLMAAMSASSRSTPRPARSSIVRYLRRRRCRHGDQRADLAGPGPWRRRPRRRPGAFGGHRLRQGNRGSSFPARSWITACRAPTISAPSMSKSKPCRPR